MLIVGLDEVGRGCWAGPLVAGAVILPTDFQLSTEAKWKLTDSKLLTRSERETADQNIREMALSIGLGWVDAATIDKVGTTTAVKRAMEQALAQIDCVYDEIIIDGHFNFLAEHPKSRAVIKADLSVPAASAASIIAKVARDKYM